MLRNIQPGFLPVAAHKHAAGILAGNVSAKDAPGETRFRTLNRASSRLRGPEPHPLAEMRHARAENASFGVFL